MSTFEQTLSLEEVEEELTVKKTLLASLHDASDAENLREQLRTNIAQLEQHQEELTSLHLAFTDADETVASRPTTSASSNSLPQTPIEMAGMANPGSLVDVPWTYASTSETASESASVAAADSSGSGEPPFLSSPSVNLPNRKRQWDNLTPYRNPKSRRTSPSPAIAEATTPSSASQGDWENTTLKTLLGSDAPEDLEDFQREQEENERRLRQRKEQEERDAEYARLLQEEFDAPALSSSPGPSATATTSFLGPASQSTLDLSQRGVGYRRMAPPPAPVFNDHSDQVSVPTYSTQHVKREPHHRLTGPSQPGALARPTQPSWSFSKPSSSKPQRNGSSYQDLSSDSDLEEIDSNQFRASASRSPRRKMTTFQHDTRPLSSSSNRSWSDVEIIDAISGPPRTVQHPNPYQPPMPPSTYGSQPAGRSSNSIFPFGDILGAAKSIGSSVTNGALALLDHQIGSYGTPPSGYAPGASYDPRSIYGRVTPGAVPSQYVRAVGSVYPMGTSNKPLDLDSFRERNPEYFDYVTNDPTKTLEEMKALLENIRPDEELPPEAREGTPDALTYPLLEHQKLGLSWMKQMEEGTNKGGILADDMGLGKTIQTLALMVSRPSDDLAKKSNLIVAPVALMQQWKREVERKVKGGRHKLSVHILHGDGKKISWPRLKMFDVVLTTYGTLASELKRKEAWRKKLREHPNIRPSGSEDHFPVLGDSSRWYRVILDEAQCIKNKNTKAAIGAWHINSEFRWCLTGTPMMNNCGELYSLIHFLRIKPYNEAERFNKDFTRPLKGNYRSAKDRAMRQLQALLKAILLRRTKQSKIDGRPILQLPPRTTEEQHALFDEAERDFYRSLENQSQLTFNKYLKKGTVGRNYSNILVLLLRLRQACCHPHLIKDHGIETGAITDGIDLVTNAKELPPDVISRLLEAEAFDCPICMDAGERTMIFIPCGHNTCSECLARISDPALRVQQGDEGSEIKCPNCRGKVDPKKVTDLVSFKKVYKPDEVADDELKAAIAADADPDTDSDEDSEDSEEENDEDDENDDLKAFVVADDVGKYVLKASNV